MAGSFPPSWGFGGLVGGAPRTDEVAAVLADLRSTAALSTRIRPNPLHDDAWSRAAAGAVALPRRAHVLDLEGGYERVWKERFSSKGRNHIRRAEKSGLVVELDTTGRLVEVFYELFLRSVDRWAAQQHEPRMLARWRAHHRDPPAKLAQLISALRGGGRLWVAWADGRPAAAILVLQGANAHYTRGAMDLDIARPTRANYLLQARAIEDACQAGCRSYHMGETGDSTALAHFKENVGGRPHPYAEYVVERLPLTSMDRAARTAAKRVMRFKDLD